LGRSRPASCAACIGVADNVTGTLPGGELAFIIDFAILMGILIVPPRGLFGYDVQGCRFWGCRRAVRVALAPVRAGSVSRKQGLNTEATEKAHGDHGERGASLRVRIPPDIARSAENPCCSVISVRFLRGLRVKMACLADMARLLESHRPARLLQSASAAASCMSSATGWNSA
jgi:hypothetical protein